MNPTFSPKEVAAAVGVSESSLKRWADEGLLEVTRTVGGHRRITLPEAVRFARSQELPVVRPDVLGLPALPAAASAPTDTTSADTVALLHGLLIDGRADAAAALLIDRYLRGQSVAQIVDGPVSAAMSDIGELWHRDGARGIFHEHRATDALIQALNTLRRLLPPPPEGAAVALGGAVPGDTHLVPSLIVAAALRERGFDDHNLGADVPLAALLSAATQLRPRLLWLACATPEQRPDDEALRPLLRYLDAHAVTLVVGGHGFDAQPPPRHARVTACRNVADLIAAVQGLQAG